MHVNLVRLLARFVHSPDLLHDLTCKLGREDLRLLTHRRLDEVGNTKTNIRLDEVVHLGVLGQAVSELDDRVEESGEGVVRGSFGRWRRGMVRGDAPSASSVASDDD